MFVVKNLSKVEPWDLDIVSNYFVLAVSPLQFGILSGISSRRKHPPTKCEQKAGKYRSKSIRIASSEGNILSILYVLQRDDIYELRTEERRKSFVGEVNNWKSWERFKAPSMHGKFKWILWKFISLLNSRKSSNVFTLAEVKFKARTYPLKSISIET